MFSVSVSKSGCRSCKKSDWCNEEEFASRHTEITTEERVELGVVRMGLLFAHWRAWLINDRDYAKQNGWSQRSWNGQSYHPFSPSSRVNKRLVLSLFIVPRRFLRRRLPMGRRRQSTSSTFTFPTTSTITTMRTIRSTNHASRLVAKIKIVARKFIPPVRQRFLFSTVTKQESIIADNDTNIPDDVVHLVHVSSLISLLILRWRLL